jgi:ribosome-interacting GTPase 1
MPVNPPREYYVAEAKYHQAKTREEKIAALEEMLRLMPRHHGSENALAQLTSRLSKLKKEHEKKGAHKIGVKKEGDAQVCILGLANSGKSTLLDKLTDAKPKISPTPYTTTLPEIGMMDYHGIKVQLIEIPSTFDPEYMSIARGCDLIVLVIKDRGEEAVLDRVIKNNFIRQKRIVVNANEGTSALKEKIWGMLGLIITYTKKKAGDISPMALPTGATVYDFASRIHKDFIKQFRFARIARKGRMIQAGLKYPLQNGDIVELYLK